MVCTHARRDVCCGTYGVPVYNALRRHVPAELLWRSSHQGGHRFAANVLALPEAVQLGRVVPGAADEVARDTGRAADPAPVLSRTHAACARGPGRGRGGAERARSRPSGGCPTRRARRASCRPRHAERIGGGHRRGARGAAASGQLRQGGGADADSRRRPCTGSRPRLRDQPCFAPCSLYELSVIQEN